MLANAQAEYDGMRGVSPLSGSLLISTNKTRLENSGQMHYAKVYISIHHNMKQITREKMDKCTTVQAAQSRFDWLAEFHQNTEGIGP